MSGQNSTVYSPVPPIVQHASVMAQPLSHDHARSLSGETASGGALRALEVAKALLSIGAIAAAGSIAVTVSVAVALLAVIVAGPFFLTAIVAVAFVVLGSAAFGATA